MSEYSKKKDGNKPATIPRNTQPPRPIPGSTNKGGDNLQ
jgi:hypothetical protein